MIKNQKSEMSRSKSRSRAKKQLVFYSNNHRIQDNDSDAHYDALYDEIDQCDWAVSERCFIEDFDRKSRNQRARSSRQCWSPDWDQDMDDWN